MLKNVAGQFIDIEAWNSATGGEHTGDAANITAYIEKDDGGAVQSNDVNPTEVDPINMPGVYRFALTQAETDCNNFAIKAHSTTANVRIGLVQTSPTPLPSALPGAAGGLPVSDAGGLDLDAALANLDAPVSGANTVTPDAAGTAAGLHAATDALINALVVPDAAGTAAGLHAATDALINALVVPDAAGTAAGLHAATDALINALVVPDPAGTAAALHAITDAAIAGLVVPDPAGTAAALHAATDALIAGLVVPDPAGTAAALHAITDALIAGLVVPDPAGTAAALHAITDAAIAALNNLSPAQAQAAAAAALTAWGKTGFALSAAGVTAVQAGLATPADVTTYEED